MLFQLQLHPRRVPDFQGDSHCRHGGGIHGYQRKPGSGVYIEYFAVRPPADFYPRHLQQHNHPEERGLPVNLRMTQHLADPAVNAEINEWREGPDLFAISSGVAQHPGDESHRQVKGQRGVFSMHKRRQRNQHRSHRPGGRPAQNPHQQDGLKGFIGGKEVFHALPHPHSQQVGHGDEDDQRDPLPQVGVLQEKQALKIARTDQGAGDGRRHAQLDKLRQQNETLVHAL